MKPGRDLDRLVSEQALRHSVTNPKKGVWYEATPQGNRPLRNYSKDIEAAFEVAERMGIALIPISKKEGGGWFALVGNGGAGGWSGPAEFLEQLQKGDFVQSGAAVAETLPHAVSLAALRAVEKRAGGSLPS